MAFGDKPNGKNGSAAHAADQAIAKASQRSRGRTGSLLPKSDAIGRKNSGGQEAVINLKRLEENLPTLVDLYNLSADHKKDYSEAVKATAQGAGLHTSVVDAITKAKARGDKAATEDEQRIHRQMTLVFDKLG